MSDPKHLPIDSLVGAQRFEPYLAECAQDLDRARRMYLWNVELSMSFWGPLSILEVLTRNALHAHLSSRFGSYWYLPGQSTLKLRRDHEARHVTSALNHLNRVGRTSPSPDDFVGATSFGLWVGLVSAGEVVKTQGADGQTVFDGSVHYARTLWTPNDNLTIVFPYLGDSTRKQLHSKLSDAQKVRNRIAHHERIVHLPHIRLLKSIIDVIAMISPDTASFVRKTESVSTVVQGRSAAVLDGDCSL